MVLPQKDSLPPFYQWTLGLALDLETKGGSHVTLLVTIS